MVNLISSHPVSAKALEAGVTPLDFCKDICEGSGKGCEGKSANVMQIFKQLVDKALKRKVFDCKKHTT